MRTAGIDECFDIVLLVYRYQLFELFSFSTESWACWFLLSKFYFANILSRRQGSTRQRETEGGGGEDDVGGGRAHGVDTRSDTRKASP